MNAYVRRASCFACTSDQRPTAAAAAPLAGAPAHLIDLEQLCGLDAIGAVHVIKQRHLNHLLAEGEAACILLGLLLGERTLFALWCCCCRCVWVLLLSSHSCTHKKGPLWGPTSCGGTSRINSADVVCKSRGSQQEEKEQQQIVAVATGGLTHDNDPGHVQRRQGLVCIFAVSWSCVWAGVRC